MKKITLKYWQKTYLATLALFLCCLAGSIGAVFSLGQRQNFSSTVNEALAQQQYLMQSLVQDAQAVAASRPAALPNLYEYYSTQYAGGGIPLEVTEQDTVLYSTLPTVEGERTRPEVPQGQRVYLVLPTEEGRQLFVSSRLATVSHRRGGERGVCHRLVSGACPDVPAAGPGDRHRSSHCGG